MRCKTRVPMLSHSHNAQKQPYCKLGSQYGFPSANLEFGDHSPLSSCEAAKRSLSAMV
ncbi:hypothetical protein PCO31010_00201 [Pandoraea commovens]|uniref:Uncharacterized protein n=1 Tax=Pandoraea commovens TaxID=2508289 RepID=A0A5E4RK60_9BURK|nr:hypothetical protein PCO31010_00201 [Pandoraea commovens]